MVTWTNCRHLLDLVVTLRASCGVVYCNRCCLFVCVCVGGSVTTITRNCVHGLDPHQTGFIGKGNDHLQLIKFRPSRAPGKGSAAGRKILAPPYYSQRAVFALFCMGAFSIFTVSLPSWQWPWMTFEDFFSVFSLYECSLYIRRFNLNPPVCTGGFAGLGDCGSYCPVPYRFDLCRPVPYSRRNPVIVGSFNMRC